MKSASVLATSKPLKPEITAGDRVHAAVMALTGVFTSVAWTLYWTTDLFKKPDDPLWNKFEDPFVLPDTAMCIALWFSAYWLMKGDSRCVPAGIAAGGALVFLFLLDFLFNVQNGYYLPITSDNVIEVFFNVVCLALGPLTIVRLWRRRFVFDQVS